MSFGQLPPEIHSAVSSVSDISSKLSLCLVSKYFYDITLPHLYEVLCLPTRPRFLSLATTFTYKPEFARLVRHLFASDRNSYEFYVSLPDFIVCFPQNDKERTIRRQRIREWLSEREQELAAYRFAIHQVLSLTSPFLKSLTLLHYEHALNILHGLLLLPFPNLVELTIRGDYPPFPPGLYLPALERLHLAAGDTPNPFASLATIADGCPRLTHLRITEPIMCILAGPLLAHTIEIALGYATCNNQILAATKVADKCGREVAVGPPRLPPTLTHLLLQTYAAELNAFGVPYPDHVEMQERLDALQKKSDIFRLLSPLSLAANDYSLPYCFEVAHRHWEDRMEGGDGCWEDCC
ncbi:hypothetical protein BD410DRAFT_834035 [Rickenella mellea]|uniref:F-box domain-containing protein n=1 Tax=Rickenella mellea TaxID=50990 RepID=A0A4R5XG69_9AGAM|nr:hypothetical protein BD410DRAFT_834035 [Rickenella mellea]